MKRWETLDNFQFSYSNFQIDKLLDILLANRGITTKKDKEVFLNPNLEAVTAKLVGIDDKQLQKALKRIKKAIDGKEQIVVFGDYDVDGITGSAILWETLHELGAKVVPYIPHRIDEGYGLSIKGITNLKEQIENIGLIITTDNGIVASKAVDFANEQKIDVIITDHHTTGEKLPDAYAIVHTTNLCGAGVAYILSKEIRSLFGTKEEKDVHLELAALGTVADLVPLTDASRAIVKHGLPLLCKTKRVGLIELYKQAGLEKDVFSVYEIGYVIAPRLNAAGRIESAMDSLRLLCTKSKSRAEILAEQLELTNRERQMVMKKAADHAKEVVHQKEALKNVLVVAHEEYPPGVIGLVAGKLVEEFYRPSIVLSIGETHSKASARSISGFNIIEFLRTASAHLVDVGGHPMAAGFTIETKNLTILQEFLEGSVDTFITAELLTRVLKIDCDLPLGILDQSLYKAIQYLSPFGMGNPEPVFASRGVTVENMRLLGKENTHLKLWLKADGKSFEAIAFGMGSLASDLQTGSKIDVAYTLDENTWNGNTKLQLKVKDISFL
jgi:single-stranded-DNA-specific exonuclease